MSGIYGIVRFDGAPVSREALAPMASAIAFWGRNGHGQWCGDSAGLGHLMLHTTAESLRERLPVSLRAAPHLIITADARIDNRAELFDALGVTQAGREQTPDSSLILLAYERWGAEFVPRLLGDFAFAIWDTRERKLFCARDPFGCMPFVYLHDEKRFVFASDIKGVLAVVDEPRLNEALLAAHLQFRTYYAEKRQTFFQSIVKLPPGHTLTVSAAGAQISRYWSPEQATEVRLASAGEYAEKLALLFRQAVECRLRSAFPIGSHLSGGLDSSSVTVAAARALRALGRDLAVFSWSPPPGAETECTQEGEYARMAAVCSQERLLCEYYPPTPASLTETLKKNYAVEPTAMMALETNVQVGAEAKGLRVILSGWGGDEAVTCAAITPPIWFLQQGNWSELQASLRQRFRPAQDSAGMLSPFLMARRTAGILRETIEVSLPDSLYALMGRNPYQKLQSPCCQPAFSHQYRAEVEGLRGPAFRRRPGVKANISSLIENGQISYRAEHWATSGSSHGLIYRYPMLDRRLVEFALGIPPSPSTEFGQRRALFRHAEASLLPDSVDWTPAKKTPATTTAFEKNYIAAHADWAREYLRSQPGNRVNRFVDVELIYKGIQNAQKSGQVKGLIGIWEAIGCLTLSSAAE